LGKIVVEKEFMSTIQKLVRSWRRDYEHLEGVPFLTVSQLSVRYDGMPALDQIDFSLEGEEFVAVVGPNGAGKSTLFKTIAGVITPTEGRVTLGGHEPTGHICIAYLPQRSDVDWGFPVAVKDVVMMGRVGKIGLFRNPRPEDWEVVTNCLKMVNMEELINRQINELSGGQQQRVFIAQALAQEAELLLMDEPLAGLDVPSQEEFFKVLQLLRERSVTLMVATHDLGLAAAHFDKVMLLNGSLMGFGSQKEVFTEKRLIEAYGNHLHLVQTEDGVVFVEHT
jgi:manganese/iron transport system ATP-binding protein